MAVSLLSVSMYHSIYYITSITPLSLLYCYTLLYHSPFPPLFFSLLISTPPTPLYFSSLWRSWLEHSMPRLSPIQTIHRACKAFCWWYIGSIRSQCCIVHDCVCCCQVWLCTINYVYSYINIAWNVQYFRYIGGGSLAWGFGYILLAHTVKLTWMSAKDAYSIWRISWFPPFISHVTGSHGAVSSESTQEYVTMKVNLCYGPITSPHCLPPPPTTAAEAVAEYEEIGASSSCSPQTKQHRQL